MKLDWHIPIVRGTVNGHVVNLIVDTGGNTTIFAEYATDLGLDVQQGDAYTLRDSDGRERKIHYTLIEKLTIGPLELEGLTVSILASPLLAGRGGGAETVEDRAMTIHGWVGLSAFSSVVVAFDFPASEIHVSSYYQKRPGDVPLPLELPHWNRPTIAVDIDDQRYWLVLDTGRQSGLVLPRERAEGIGLAYGPVDGDEGVIWDGSWQSRPVVRLADDFTIGAMTLRTPIAALAPPTAEGGFGILGMEVLKHFVVTVDCLERTVWLRTSQHMLEAQPLQDLGFSRGDSGNASWVRKGSDAASKLKVGDKLISVGGIPIEKLEHDKWHELEASPEPVEVIIERDGAQHVLHVKPHVLVP